MDTGNRGLPSRDKTETFFFISFFPFFFPELLPEFADVRLFVHKSVFALDFKDDVFAQNGFPVTPFGEPVRVPAFQKRGDGFQAGIVRFSCQIGMLFPESLKRFQAAFFIALVVHTKHVAGIVPEKIGNHFFA